MLRWSMMPYGAASQSSTSWAGNLGAVLALWAMWKCHLPELEGMRPCGMQLAAPCLPRLSGNPWQPSDPGDCPTALT